MRFEYSVHWQKQRLFRPEITDDIIELCIISSSKIRDRNEEDTWNAISAVPPSGRTLKVVYKEKSKTIKIISAYWLH